MTKPRAGGTELFAVRFPVETLATVKRVAVEREVSAGALVVHLVEDGLARREVIDLSATALANVVERERYEPKP